MTIHARPGYECPKCSVHYAPFPPLDQCPQCKTKASEVFLGFIEDTRKSALYNLSRYDSFIPNGWAILSVCDQYYSLAFKFLSNVSITLGVDEKQLLKQEITEIDALKLASDFTAKIEFGDQVYMADHLRTYFALLLCAQESVSSNA